MENDFAGRDSARGDKRRRPARAMMMMMVQGKEGLGGSVRVLSPHTTYFHVQVPTNHFDANTR